MLQTWAGSYKNRTGVDVSVTLPDDVENVRKTPPLPAQVAAYRHLKEHEAEITSAILQTFFKEYPELREACQADEIEQHVMAVGKEGSAYVGIGFRCFIAEEDGGEALEVS